MEKNTKTGKDVVKPYRKYRFITKEQSDTLKRFIGINYYHEFQKQFKKEYKGMAVPARSMVSNVLNGWANNHMVMKILIDMAKKGEALQEELERMSSRLSQQD